MCHAPLKKYQMVIVGRKGINQPYKQQGSYLDSYYNPNHKCFSQLALFRLPIFHFTNQYPTRNYGKPEILGYINAYKRDPY